MKDQLTAKQYATISKKMIAYKAKLYHELGVKYASK